MQVSPKVSAVDSPLEAVPAQNVSRAQLFIIRFGASCVGLLLVPFKKAYTQCKALDQFGALYFFTCPKNRGCDSSIDCFRVQLVRTAFLQWRAPVAEYPECWRQYIHILTSSGTYEPAAVFHSDCVRIAPYFSLSLNRPRRGQKRLNAATAPMMMIASARTD